MAETATSSPQPTSGSGTTSPPPAPALKDTGLLGAEINPQAGGQIGSGLNMQTDYSSTMLPGYPGMPATMVGWDTDTFVHDPAASAPLPFGRAVSLKGVAAGTTEKQITVGGAANFRGVSVRDITQMPSQLPVGVDGYPAGWLVGCARRGDIWVRVKGAVTAASPVKFVPATGEFGSDVGATVTVPNAEFRLAAADGGLTILRLHSPLA